MDEDENNRYRCLSELRDKILLRNAKKSVIYISYNFDNINCKYCSLTLRVYRILYIDLNIPYVTDVIQERSNQHYNNLEAQPKPLLKPLLIVCFPGVTTLWLYFHSPVAGFSLLVFEVSWSHNDAPQSVGLLWTSDQPVAETSTSQHTTFTTDKHPCPRWDSNPQSQQASGRRPTP